MKIAVEDRALLIVRKAPEALDGFLRVRMSQFMSQIMSQRRSPTAIACWLPGTGAQTKGDTEDCLGLVTQDEVEPLIATALRLEQLHYGPQLKGHGNSRGRLAIDA